MDTNCSYFAVKYAPVTLVERLRVYNKIFGLILFEDIDVSL